MHYYKFLFLIVTIAVGLAGCSKSEVNTDEKLIGQWDVTKVEGRQVTNGVPGIVLTDENPTGFIRFDEDGKGEQQYSFSLFGNTYPQSAQFRWNSTEQEVVVDLIGSDDMIWSRSVNEIDRQVAAYEIVISAELTIEYELTLEK